MARTLTYEHVNGQFSLSESLALAASGRIPSFRYERATSIARPGDTPVRILLDGWACRSRLLPDGRRQIFSFLVPGDLIGVSAEAHPASRCDVFSLTRAMTVGIGALVETHAGQTHVIIEARRLAEARLFDHLTRLGSYSAFEAVGHLFLDFEDRLGRVGLLQDGSFPMPLSQRTLAAALGISGVHLNRTINELRRRGFMEQAAGSMRLPGSEQLAAIVGFVAAKA